jgi:hypothetical protein
MKHSCECECHKGTKDSSSEQSWELRDRGAQCVVKVVNCCYCHAEHCDEKGFGGKDCRCSYLGRPGKQTGTDGGRLDQPNPVLTPGDLTHPNPPGVWVGPRKDLFLPFLFMRTTAGDTGTRPAVGPFWESPDILLLAGTDPAAAPPIPPELGQTALANAPNTLYAHIWNFGQAQAAEVVVEFYWCDPSIGIGPNGAHLIGQAFTSLGARGSGKAHRVVRCPIPWVPTFVNGGHECLLVRVWDIASDPLSNPAWDARLNRHIAQRNIHVVQTGPALPMMLAHKGGMQALTAALDVPLTLKVGPLYGQPATVTVDRIVPSSMPWLQLRTGARGIFPVAATPTGTPLLSAPTTIGAGVTTGKGAAQHKVEGDDQQVAFTTTDRYPGPGEAHVYRVAANQDGVVFGGYTVVLVG